MAERGRNLVLGLSIAALWVSIFSILLPVEGLL